MQIIIPMSGFGNRFLSAGYKKPKPLLKVDGKPIVEYVLSMFPGENDISFICNEEHIENTDMTEVLESIAPHAKIHTIPPHKKGPTYAVSKIFDSIKDDEPVMVSYCDYFMDWDYEKFKKEMLQNKYDGAIPCYTGFHPHLLKENVYAGVLTDENRAMKDIQEKHCFTPSLFDCHHSAGAYYFKSGRDVKKYFQELMDMDININGEYYVSMVYYLYKRDNKKVFIPEVDYFMQWGTPEDLEEYEAWSKLFAKELNKKKGETDIPEERRDKIKINHNPDTKEYTKTYSYWEKYFSKPK